jgi:cell division protein FtsZ
VNNRESLIQIAVAQEDAPKEIAGQARIVIAGVGGAGNNSADRLFRMGIRGATVVAMNTDSLHLNAREANAKLLLGKELTRGLGAGGYPEIGKAAAKECRSEIRDLLKDCDLTFITAGMGGGTGTGGAPIVAEIAKEQGSIVIGVVTMPFKMEKARIFKAEQGLYELRQIADTVIVIDNNRLVEVAGKLPIGQAFRVADELIATMIKGIVETIAVPSLVNLDYADVKAVMTNGGVAVIGVGESSNSDNRADEAVRKALNHPLLDVEYEGATGAMIHVTGGPDLTLEEANRIGELVSERLDPSAQVIWGARVDPTFEGAVRVMTIITGVKSPHILGRIDESKPTLETVETAKILGIPVVSQRQIF